MRLCDKFHQALWPSHSCLPGRDSELLKPPRISIATRKMDEPELLCPSGAAFPGRGPAFQRVQPAKKPAYGQDCPPHAGSRYFHEIRTSESKVSTRQARVPGTSTRGTRAGAVCNTAGLVTLVQPREQRF